jgi:tRNA (guanine-N7-)-methyltransferase
MPRNKLSKYARVKRLPNVTFPAPDESPPACSYPWYHVRYEGMQRVLELGCGKGEHTLAFAAADPGKLCVGVDSKSHRICVGAEKALDLRLENVQFLHARIERIEEYFVANTIDEIWLTFPDPHIKNRETKFRLTAPPFLNAYANLVVPGALVHLKTDSPLFYTYTLKTVESWGGQIVAASVKAPDEGLGQRSLSTLASAFENAAQKRGTDIKYMAFRLH